MSFFWNASLWIKPYWNLLGTDKNYTYANILLLFSFFEQSKTCKVWIVFLDHCVTANFHLYAFMETGKLKLHWSFRPPFRKKLLRLSVSNGHTFLSFSCIYAFSTTRLYLQFYSGYLKQNWHDGIATCNDLPRRWWWRQHNEVMRLTFMVLSPLL